MDHTKENIDIKFILLALLILVMAFMVNKANAQDPRDYSGTYKKASVNYKDMKLPSGDLVLEVSFVIEDGERVAVLACEYGDLHVRNMRYSEENEDYFNMRGDRGFGITFLEPDLIGVVIYKDDPGFDAYRILLEAVFKKK